MNAITRNELAHLDAPTVSFTLNGKEVQGKTTDTLITIAQREGIAIPHHDRVCGRIDRLERRRERRPRRVGRRAQPMRLERQPRSSRSRARLSTQPTLFARVLSVSCAVTGFSRSWVSNPLQINNF
jgi:hypothetical protein